MHLFVKVLTVSLFACRCHKKTGMHCEGTKCDHKGGLSMLRQLVRPLEEFLPAFSVKHVSVQTHSGGSCVHVLEALLRWPHTFVLCKSSFDGCLLHIVGIKVSQVSQLLCSQAITSHSNLPAELQFVSLTSAACICVVQMWSFAMVKVTFVISYGNNQQKKNCTITGKEVSCKRFE